MKKLHFVVCTKHNAIKFQTDSDIYQFFNDNKLIEGVDYTVIYNNTKGLSQRYNEFLSEYYQDRIVVFVHDDVQLTHSISTITRELNTGH